jgi:hypothetical protein
MKASEERRKIVTDNPYSGCWYAWFEGMNEDGENVEGGQGSTQWEAITELVTWWEESHMPPGPPPTDPIVKELLNSVAEVLNWCNDIEDNDSRLPLDLLERITKASNKATASYQPEMIKEQSA